MVLVAAGAQTLALLEQEVDDERHERPGDGSDDGDPEQHEQPADDEAAERGDVARIALSEDGEDRPVEGLPEPFDGRAHAVVPRLLDERDEECRDADEDRRALGEAQEEAPIDRAGNASRVPRDPSNDRGGDERGEWIEASDHGRLGPPSAPPDAAMSRPRDRTPR